MEEETIRRSAAIRAVVEYCDIQEGDTQRVTFAASKTSVGHTKDMALSEAPIDPSKCALQAAVNATYRKEGPFICPDCVGVPKSPLIRRTKEYTTAGSLARHYRQVHINKIKSSDEITCGACRLSFRGKSHKQAHAYSIHHITT
jgi:hypothetical protein